MLFASCHLLFSFMVASAKTLFIDLWKVKCIADGAWEADKNKRLNNKRFVLIKRLGECVPSPLYPFIS